MSLKTLNLQTRTVETPGGNLTVRGISLSEILLLANAFKPVMESVFREMMEATDDVDPVQRATDLTARLFTDVPEFISSIIVLGCGESLDDKESMKVASLLDLGSQVALVNAIGEVTFAAGGGAKNVVRLVVNAVTQTTSLIQDR